MVTEGFEKLNRARETITNIAQGIGAGASLLTADTGKPLVKIVGKKVGERALKSVPYVGLGSGVAIDKAAGENLPTAIVANLAGDMLGTGGASIGAMTGSAAPAAIPALAIGAQILGEQIVYKAESVVLDNILGKK